MAEKTPDVPFNSAEMAYAQAAEAVTAKPVPAPEITPPAPKIAPKAAKPAPVKKTAVAAKKAAKTAAPKPVSRKPKPAPAPQLKDKIMTTAKTKTADFAETVKEALADAQTKAKTALGKGMASASEAGEFAKGNVEALVESGKILAEGMKVLGNDYVAEGKKAYETLTADAKELAAIKSPTDFFQFQAKLLRRNFDSAVAFSSKNTEATMKLVNDAFAPLSTRFSLAMDKAKKAA